MMKRNNDFEEELLNFELWARGIGKELMKMQLEEDTNRKLIEQLQLVVSEQGRDITHLKKKLAKK